MAIMLMQTQGTTLLSPIASYFRHPLRSNTFLARARFHRQCTLRFGRTKALRQPRSITCDLDVESSVSAETNSQTENVIGGAEPAADVPSETSISSGGTNEEPDNFMEGPTKAANRIIAFTSAVAAISLFVVTRGGFSGTTLGELAAGAIPYEQALSNGRPTVLEFYADWCEVCREMAPEVYKVEQQYKNLVNFVMLNVDNRKWEEEFDEFGVEGIPHFAFLDKQGNEEGNIVGKLPKKYLEDNVAALAKGEQKIPHTRVVGQFSSADSRQAPPIVEPRSHGT